MDKIIGTESHAFSKEFLYEMTIAFGIREQHRYMSDLRSYLVMNMLL